MVHTPTTPSSPATWPLLPHNERPHLRQRRRSQAANQGTSQAIGQTLTSVGSVAQSITLSASNTTPAVGQPVTFTATLTARQSVYSDYANNYLLGILGIENQAQGLGPPQHELARGANVFLGTYNVENNKVRLFKSGVVSGSTYLENATSFTSNRSLIYSNGGASVYS